jgi:hypothetical protein
MGGSGPGSLAVGAFRRAWPRSGAGALQRRGVHGRAGQGKTTWNRRGRKKIRMADEICARRVAGTPTALVRAGLFPLPRDRRRRERTSTGGAHVEQCRAVLTIKR